jgi:hypothetical protein
MKIPDITQKDYEIALPAIKLFKKIGYIDESVRKSCNISNSKLLWILVNYTYFKQKYGK